MEHQGIGQPLSSRLMDGQFALQRLRQRTAVPTLWNSNPLMNSVLSMRPLLPPIHRQLQPLRQVDLHQTYVETLIGERNEANRVREEVLKQLRRPPTIAAALEQGPPAKRLREVVARTTAALGADAPPWMVQTSSLPCLRRLQLAKWVTLLLIHPEDT